MALNATHVARAEATAARAVTRLVSTRRRELLLYFIPVSTDPVSLSVASCLPCPYDVAGE